jgi:hypothetical protein
MGTHQGDLFIRLFFALVQFHVLHYSSGVPCYFLLSLANDTHILDLAHVVSLAFDHFASKLVFMGLFVQLCKCLAWAPSGLLLVFILLSKFCCPFGGIKSLGIPFGSTSFTSSFLQSRF